MKTESSSLNGKISFREKLAFGIANFGNIPIMIITGSFLLIFYTDVVGLNPASCATLFLVARVFDGVNDPFIGFFIDHLPYTKRGRFRPVLAIGALLTSINFLLVFLGPYLAGGFKLGIAYITYMLLGVLFPLMDISLNSLLPVMTADIKERTSLSTIKGAFYMIGAVGLNIAAPIIVGNTSIADGYVVLIIFISIVVALFSFIDAAGVKERIKPVEGQKYKVRDLLRIISQRPVAAQFLCILITTTGGYIVQTANLYFYTYILGNITLFSIISFVMMLALFPGIFISGILVPRLGKKNVFLCALLVSGIAPLLRLICITNFPLLIVSSLLAGFGQGLMMPLLYGMQADNTDYVELAIGYRTEAAVASLSSFITKFAMGVGGAIPGYLLAWYGYNASLDVQSTAVNNAIIFCVCVAPTVFIVIGLIIMAVFYPLTKQKLEQQEEEIRKRHTVS